MSFPIDRPRRLRCNSTMRDLVRETQLSASDLVQPLFIVPGQSIRKEIPSLPGQYHLSADEAAKEALKIRASGVPAVLLFGIPSHKDAIGSGAWDREGEVQRTTKLIKSQVPDLLVITDVCLCEYTDHGHCGVLVGEKVNNDPTLELLMKTAISHAQAGADIIAPSDMMDGRVAKIRRGLDEAGFTEIAILSYSAKYASSYYGPFREAAKSAPQYGDRKAYQMDPANRLEALREVELDLEEGADIIMVKPGIAYLDVLSEIKRRYNRVTAAYQVSGEYAMIEAAAAQGWIDRKSLIMETLTCFKRAGADFIISYYATEAAVWLKDQTR